MVLSHHGRLEFGSPKVPLFSEAILLHYLDDLDSKMECVRALEAQDKLVEGEWTAYSSPLERSILKKLRYLQGEGEETEATRPTPAIATHAREEARAATPKTPTLFGEKLSDALQSLEE
jgi:3'-5' exoribonuclease